MWIGQVELSRYRYSFCRFPALSVSIFSFSLLFLSSLPFLEASSCMLFPIFLFNQQYHSHLQASGGLTICHLRETRGKQLLNPGFEERPPSQKSLMLSSFSSSVAFSSSYLRSEGGEIMLKPKITIGCQTTEAAHSEESCKRNLPLRRLVLCEERPGLKIWSWILLLVQDSTPLSLWKLLLKTSADEVVLHLPGWNCLFCGDAGCSFSFWNCKSDSVHRAMTLHPRRYTALFTCLFTV